MSETSGKESHDFNLGDRGRSSFATSQRRHDRWKTKREEASGYADVEHSFRHQGSADLNLYKLFLEQAHALLRTPDTEHRTPPRLGLIVPSGLYSDFGTGELRRLFVDQCRWEWLFGFENRAGIFDIHRSFKFNPIIVAKGGQTKSIRTAFMRRGLADWERGEQFATDYSREQVVQFSPISRAILEIQSQRDLEVLTKIYANSVLLGDQSERGWGIQYAREFDMTNDSKLFPPRPKWEEWGYRPDEYSRWIKGLWQPIEKLYVELGVQSPPAGEHRCAQPPYDKLPIPRADIPAGIILSRTATHFINEDDIPEVTFTDASGKPLKIKVENEEGEKEEIDVLGPAVALPLYQGVMLGAFDPTKSGWLSGTGLNARWEAIAWNDKQYRSQFLIGEHLYATSGKGSRGLKVGFRDIARTTDTRTMICCMVPDFPSGNKVPVLTTNRPVPALQSVLNSLAYDWAERMRQGATSINYFIAEETPLPSSHAVDRSLKEVGLQLGATMTTFAVAWMAVSNRHAWKSHWALTDLARMELRCSADALAATGFGLQWPMMLHVLRECDLPHSFSSDSGLTSSLFSKGFWRVDKAKPPEHRHTVLSLIAFHDLQAKIAECGGDVEQGIEAFCNQNEGEGWMLPETLRLADYGLGHDERAREHQPIRECFGPRFYDWQLAQSPEESWRECHLHARNLLGPEGYQALLDELEGRTPPPPKSSKDAKPKGGQKKLFETESLPLFDNT